VNVEALLADLRSDDWQVAVRAARRLREEPGDAVTGALVDALDAHDTAITAAATESLILRNEPTTVDRLWTVLRRLDEDVTDHMWDVIGSLPDEAVSQELERRFNAQR
jgi:HEAT repeat protein